MKKPLITLAAAIAATFASASAAPTPVPDSTSDVIEILVEHRRSGETGGPAARRALAELGTSAIPAICSILSGRTTGSEHGFHGPLVDPPTRALLIDAMRSWPTDRVVERIEETAGKDATLSGRLRVIDLVGEIGDGESLTAVFDQLEALSPTERQHRVVTTSFGRAFDRIARRDARALGTASARLQELDPGLMPALAATLGELSLGQGFDILERMLRRSPQLDVVVLQAVGGWKPWKPEYVEGDCVRLTRSFLLSSDEAVRRQAAITLGELRDGESVPDLIELLSDPARSVQKAAQRALQEISGLGWTADAGRWERWFAEENAWFDASAADIDRLTDQTDPATSAATLHEVRQHPFFRDKLAPTITPLLEHDEATIAASAAEALGRLGDASAVYPLVRALEDERAGVRAAAQNALCNLTRMRVGNLTASEWLERLDA